MTFSSDKYQEFMVLYNGTAEQVGQLFGLTPKEMHKALWCARISKVTRMPLPPSSTPWTHTPLAPPGRLFCVQCDRLVKIEEGKECSSPWCKAKEAA